MSPFGPPSSGPGLPPMGPSLPPGGIAPPQGTSAQGSPLLAALMASAGGVDPYGVPPEMQGSVTDGIGTGDPNMGIQEILQLLAMAQMGVGGGVFPGQSGVDADYGNMGQAAGLGGGMGGAY